MRFKNSDQDWPSVDLLIYEKSWLYYSQFASGRRLFILWRSDDRSQRFVQDRVDQSLGRRPRSLLSQLSVTVKVRINLKTNSSERCSNPVLFGTPTGYFGLQCSLLRLLARWLVGCWGFTTVPVTKTIRLSEWVTPGDTAIPGMTSLKDGDLQHSSALAQSPKEI